MGDCRQFQVAAGGFRSFHVLVFPQITDHIVVPLQGRLRGFVLNPVISLDLLLAALFNGSK